MRHGYPFNWVSLLEVVYGDFVSQDTTMLRKRAGVISRRFFCGFFYLPRPSLFVIKYSGCTFAVFHFQYAIRMLWKYYFQ